MSKELITVAKAGEGKIHILIDHLEEHVRLGWQRVEDEVKEVEKEIDLELIDIEKATAKELRALLASMSVEIPTGAKVGDLRDLALAAKTDPNQGAGE